MRYWVNVQCHWCETLLGSSHRWHFEVENGRIGAGEGEWDVPLTRPLRGFRGLVGPCPKHDLKPTAAPMWQVVTGEEVERAIGKFRRSGHRQGKVSIRAELVEATEKPPPSY